MERLTALNNQLEPNLTASTTPTPTIKSTTIIGESLKKTLPGPWLTADEKYGNMEIVNKYFNEGKAHILMKKWREEYGPIYAYYSYEAGAKAKVLRVVLSDIGEVRRILKMNPVKPRGYEQSIILGEGILSNSNPTEWARQRKILKPVFSNEALRDLLPIMKNGSKVLSSWLEELDQKGEKFDIHDLLSEFTFLMIGHSALGEESEYIVRRGRELRQAFTVAGMKELLRLDVLKDENYLKARKEIKDFARETFERYETSNNPQAEGCPFHRKQTLISVVMGKEEDGKPVFNAKQRDDELSTFMFAG